MVISANWGQLLAYIGVLEDFVNYALNISASDSLQKGTALTLNACRLW